MKTSISDEMSALAHKIECAQSPELRGALMKEARALLKRGLLENAGHHYSQRRKKKLADKPGSRRKKVANA